MLKVLFPNITKPHKTVNSLKRYFLSDAFKCEEAWESRLKNPAFQKINLENLYHDLDTNFQKKKRIRVLDIDLLINGMNSSFRNELDDVLLQLRKCPETILLPDRTNHAAIRWYIKHSSTKDLLNVLSDRLNYGLFPDYFLNNLLMDKYLKENDMVSALKIAVLQMLQEDVDNEIMKMLTLHCCYKYMESEEVWESYKEPEPDPDEEVKKVRVSYVRNPYFDDHFDITDTNHLVGKTLWMFGRSVEGEMGVSSQVVGLVLYEKYEKCVELLESINFNNQKIHEEAVEKAKEYCLKKPKQLGAEDGTPEPKPSEPKGKILHLLDQIKKENRINGNLLLESEELVKKAVQEHETSEIKHQIEVYQQWEKDRENHIQTEIRRAEVERVKEEIKKTKAELAEKQVKLFFFDREEEILLTAERKDKEKASVVYYQGKGKHREKVTDEYIPPDVSQKKTN